MDCGFQFETERFVPPDAGVTFCSFAPRYDLMSDSDGGD
jgi:hypothetical protein